MHDVIPNAAQARIDPRKLRDYALNREHSSGRYKAEYFAPMGYTADNWQRLERDIREQLLIQPALPGRESPFGRKYVINAPLQGPQGELRYVTTVWIIRPSNEYPELVTIFPEDRPEEPNDEDAPAT